MYKRVYVTVKGKVHFSTSPAYSFLRSILLKVCISARSYCFLHVVVNRASKLISRIALPLTLILKGG